MARSHTDEALATGRGAQRPVANSLTVVGSFLVVIGGWSLLRTIGLVPDVVAEVLDDWWALALVLAGGVMAWRGRRAAGGVLVLIGAVILTFALVPGRLVAPTLLIGTGLVLVIGALGGRRWFTGRPGDALFDAVRGSLFRDRPARSIVAIFDEAIGTIDAGAAGGVVECLAVLGDVEVTVSHDVALELRQTAVFGDVRAPDPPHGTAIATVQVRATSVFGDVRIVRA